MEVKKKMCDGCNELKRMWKRQGKEKFCKGCWYKMKPKTSSFTKPPKRIKPISGKRAKQNAIYEVLKKAYLKSHPFCEVHDCKNESDQIHHKNGRRGERLYDDRFFMACCGVCHPKRIHENPDWSKEHGYLI